MKGVSDKHAQNNKKIKGDKNNVKKPLQVLHISKKDTIRTVSYTHLTLPTKA